jgi:hypothetical protein
MDSVCGSPKILKWQIENIFILPIMNISFEHHSLFGVSNVRIRWKYPCFLLRILNHNILGYLKNEKGAE